MNPIDGKLRSPSEHGKLSRLSHEARTDSICGVGELRPVLIALSLWFAASLAALLAIGLRPVAPTAFLVLILAVAPWAWGMLAIPRALAHRGHYALIAFAGLIYVWVSSITTAIWLVGIIVFCVAAFFRWQSTRERQLMPSGFAEAIVAIVIGYLAVWNTNYVVLALLGQRSFDPALKAIDILLYRSVFHLSITYAGSFPLVKNSWALGLLQAAYSLLFAEIGAALMFVSKDYRQVRLLIVRLFWCYAVGILVFAAFPVAGPYLFFPESIAESIGGTTRLTMKGGLTEFNAIRSGGQPLTGFGYFVGLPSLHSAIAALLQLTFNRSSRERAFVAPLNVLVIISTCVLGYHYLLDTVTGVLLGAAAFYFLW